MGQIVRETDHVFFISTEPTWLKDINVNLAAVDESVQQIVNKTTIQNKAWRNFELKS